MPASLVELVSKPAAALGSSVARGRDGVLHYGGLAPSLTELLDIRVHRYAHREAVVEPGGQRLTYRELWGRAARVAGGLLEHGIGLGDRVGIDLPNGVRWVEAFLGALLSGAVPVPLHDGCCTGERDQVLADSALDYVLDDALPTGTAFIDDGASLSEVALLCYTRGIAGRPKGVELTNENLLSAIESVVRALALPADGIRNLVLLPFAHATGCVDQLLPTLAVGGTVITAAVDDVPKVLATERIDVLTAGPQTLAQLTGGASVRQLCCSGGILDQDTTAAVLQAFPGARLCALWGATETSGIGLLLSHEGALTHPGSAGVPFGGTEFALWGPDAGHGIGELLCRGPNVTRGYWNDPDASRKMFTDNWFHTGELARIDAGGFVRLLGSVEQPLAQAVE